MYSRLTYSGDINKIQKNYSASENYNSYEPSEGLSLRSQPKLHPSTVVLCELLTLYPLFKVISNFAHF